MRRSHPVNKYPQFIARRSLKAQFGTDYKDIQQQKESGSYSPESTQRGGEAMIDTKFCIQDRAFLSRLGVTTDEAPPMVSALQVEVERDLNRMLRKELSAAVQQQKRIDKSRKLWMAAALMWFGLSVQGCCCG
jgi:hypothetical protein